MPGFLITNMENTPDLSKISGANRLYKKTRINNTSIQTSTLDKFQNDKVFFDCPDSFIVTEGVLLNSADFNKETDLASSLINEIHNNGAGLFSRLYGGYSGAFLDKSDNKWTFWTNHTGDSAVFWYFDKSTGAFAVGSQFDFVLDTLRLNNISVHFDESAAYSLLTYAFMCDERTYVKEIKRLFPGTCIEISDTKYTISTYWTLTGNKIDFANTSKEEIINHLDKLFTEAVKLEYDKDVEYNYEHLADLSGGFDARMVNWVAHELGYSPALNLHYSQTGSSEEKLARKIAKKLGNKIIVRHLDDIEFVYAIDELTKMNCGLSIYSGSTGCRKALSEIDFKKYGLEHTGMIGDVVIGTYIDNLSQMKDKKIQNTYSSKLIHKLDTEHINRYSSVEMQIMHIRGFIGMCTPYMIRRNFTEPVAAFMYPPFLEYCLSIPVEMRLNHQLYNQWVLSKHPDAAKINWDQTDAKLSTPPFIAKWKHRFLRLPAKILSKLKIKPDNYGMNPYQYWYDTKPEFRQFCQTYYNDNINKPIFSDELKTDMKYLFENGNPLEKLQVLTVLAVGRNYF